MARIISSARVLLLYLANAKTSFASSASATISSSSSSSTANQHHRRMDMLSGVQDQPYGENTFTTQPSEILGVKSVDPTPDYHDYLPYVYVVFGNKGEPHVRAIVEPEDDCPSAQYSHTGKSLEKLNELYDGSSPIKSFGEHLSDPNQMPYRFPVKLCGVTISMESPYFEDIKNGIMKLKHKGKEYDVPQVKANPSKFLLLGDTGMRIKPTNLGLGKLGDDNTADGGYDCNGPQIYGVKQCVTNFTKADLTEDPAGSFQGLNEWYFQEIANAAADEDPDVVVFVGDYLYRQGPCPEGAVNSANNKVKECSGVNAYSHMNETIEDDKLMNFMPGLYGDNWWGWWADWFFPAINLLKTAPIIPGRGNHEICTRGGFGYFLFMFPLDLDGHLNTCLDNFPPYAVRFEHEQFLVMDDSLINPLRKGVDHFIVTDQGCPGAPEDGSTIVPIRENRYLDPKTKNETDKQVAIFTNWFKRIEELSQGRENNFYVGHRPILGIGCNYTDIVTLDWTLQESLGPNTLDRISALITGHMHWLEVLEFEDNVLPAQMVVGNGGTMMIENKINQSSIPYIDLKVGKPEHRIEGRVKRGITKSQFGYGIMERQEDLSYEVQFKVWQPSTRRLQGSVKGGYMDVGFNLTIPAGLRKKPAPDSSSSSTTTTDDVVTASSTCSEESGICVCSGTCPDFTSEWVYSQLVTENGVTTCVVTNLSDTSTSNEGNVTTVNGKTYNAPFTPCPGTASTTAASSAYSGMEHGCLSVVVSVVMGVMTLL